MKGGSRGDPPFFAPKAPRNWSDAVLHWQTGALKSPGYRYMSRALVAARAQRGDFGAMPRQMRLLGLMR
jgi:hypothetical protein